MLKQLTLICALISTISDKNQFFPDLKNQLKKSIKKILNTFLHELEHKKYIRFGLIDIKEMNDIWSPFQFLQQTYLKRSSYSL